MVEPSDEARECVAALMAEIYDFQDFARSTGEELAVWDNRCRQALNARVDVGQAVADLIAVAEPHILALEMGGLSDQVMLTSAMLLIVADMARVAPAELGMPWLNLHRRLLVTAIAAYGRAGEDAFRGEHLQAVIAMESPLFVHAAEIIGTDDPVILGIARAAALREAPNHLTVNPDAPAEALIDIYSRLRAIAD